MLTNKTILVTGGTGSFGNTFVPMTLAKYTPINVESINDNKNQVGTEISMSIGISTIQLVNALTSLASSKKSRFQ